MRSVKFLFGILFLFMMSSFSIAAVPFSSPATPAISNDAVPAVSKKQQQLMFMKWFVNLSVKDYGKMRGKKLNFFEKFSFKLTQHRMKQHLKAAGSSESEGVNWLGLAAGLFLGPLGVLGAYLFSDDKNLIKWSWIGCGVWALIVLIIIL